MLCFGCFAAPFGARSKSAWVRVRKGQVVPWGLARPLLSLKQLIIEILPEKSQGVGKTPVSGAKLQGRVREFPYNASFRCLSACSILYVCKKVQALILCSTDGLCAKHREKGEKTCLCKETTGLFAFPKAQKEPRSAGYPPGGSRPFLWSVAYDLPALSLKKTGPWLYLVSSSSSCFLTLAYCARRREFRRMKPVAS